MCTSGGHHAQGCDIGLQVPRTAEGSGTSATRARRTMPRPGTVERWASLGTSVSPRAVGRGGRGGGRHAGTRRAGPGGAPPGCARTPAGATGSASADPAGRPPAGTRKEAADWALGVRGQARSGGGTRSAGGHLCAGLVRRFIGMAARARCPGRRTHPRPERAPRGGAVDLRGRPGVLLRELGSHRARAEA
jgi:hypothetical protein